MLNSLKNLFNPSKSGFVLEEVDHFRKVVIVQDAQFGLSIEIPVSDKPLKSAKIIAPYTIILVYEDGTQEEKRILR